MGSNYFRTSRLPLRAFPSSAISPLVKPPADPLVMSQPRAQCGRSNSCPVVTCHAGPMFVTPPVARGPTPLTWPPAVPNLPPSVPPTWLQALREVDPSLQVPRQTPRTPAHLAWPHLTASHTLNQSSPAWGDIGILWGSLALGVRETWVPILALPLSLEELTLYLVTSIFWVCKMGFGSSCFGRNGLRCDEFCVNAEQLQGTWPLAGAW